MSPTRAKLRALVLVAVVALGYGVGSSRGQTLSAPYSSDYTLVNLGSVPGVPTSYGGLTIDPSNPNTLLIGGAANGGGGVIDAIGLVRGAGNHITGFSGSATQFSTAPYIDGGLAFAPNGTLLFTGYPTNQMGEIKPSSTSPDLTVSLTSSGIASSVGTLGFVPGYAPGAGDFKIASYGGGGFYNVSLTDNGNGTYSVASATLESTPGGGPEGFIYVAPGSPLFSTPSMLMSLYDDNKVTAYSVDAGGNPIVATAQTFITGLTGAEGAFIDPVTGDFLFSTFGSVNKVIEVQGFATPTPEPSSVALLGLGVGGLVVAARRRRRRSA